MTSGYGKIIFVFSLITLIWLAFYRPHVSEEICASKTNPSEQDQCHLRLVIDTKDIRVCGKIHDQKFHYRTCWYNAIHTITSWKVDTPPFKEMCASLVTLQDRNGCYLEVAHKLASPMTCWNDKKNVFSSDDCPNNKWQALEYCGLISSEVEQQECQGFVEESFKEGSWFTDLWMKRVKKFMQEEKYDRVIQEYDWVIEADGASPYVDNIYGRWYEERAKTYEEIGQYDKAISDWRRRRESLLKSMEIIVNEDTLTKHKKKIAEIEKHISILNNSDKDIYP